MSGKYNQKNKHNHQKQYKQRDEQFKHKDPPEGKREDVYKEKTRQDLIDENIYLRWKYQGIKEYADNIEESKIAIGERFQEYQSYIVNKYLSPEIKVLTEKIKTLEESASKSSNDESKVQAELEKTQKELAETLAELETTRKELADTSAELESTKTDLSDAQHELEDAVEINEAFRIRLSECDKQISKKGNSKRIVELESRNKSLNQEIARYKLDCEQLQKEKLNAILFTILVFIVGYTLYYASSLM